MTIVFDFSNDDGITQEKLETMVMQNFWASTKVHVKMMNIEGCQVTTPFFPTGLFVA